MAVYLMEKSANWFRSLSWTGELIHQLFGHRFKSLLLSSTGSSIGFLADFTPFS